MPTPHDGEDYLAQLLGLLPPGAAWTRERDTNLARLLRAVGEELARVEGRGCELVAESDPRTTDELLADWERVLGLPDPCTGEITDPAERRAAILARLIATGDQSRTYFERIATALGLTIVIQEYEPFRAGHSGASEGLSNGPWKHTWTVHVEEADPGTSALECLFARLKPAHTLIDQYVYESTGP